mmetsp:Transcript_6070/g.8663  ORF Transcript_6070/g.8663 Transcript_6070/m.8663 type:complete len:87 (-) Transcript_6070:183-443(-)
MLPNCLGPAGVVKAPIPIDDRSFDVAESEAVKTAGFRREFSEVFGCGLKFFSCCNLPIGSDGLLSLKGEVPFNRSEECGDTWVSGP